MASANFSIDLNPKLMAAVALENAGKEFIDLGMRIRAEVEQSQQEEK